MKNSISSIIENGSKLTFKPNQSFYDSVGINKKRWGQIYRGDKDPLITEVKSISEFFQIPINSFY